MISKNEWPGMGKSRMRRKVGGVFRFLIGVKRQDDGNNKRPAQDGAWRR
jgi:hypothetical protein